MAKPKGPDLIELMKQQAAHEARVHAPPGSGASPTQRERAGREVDEETFWVERDRIESNPAQPRKTFKKEDLQALGESLRADGQLQALVVRPHPLYQGKYQLVSGERRWRASAPQYGDVARLRVTVRQVSDEEALRLALIENVQRKDLDAIEVARGLRDLASSTRVDNNEELGALVGFTRARVQQLLALLALPKTMQKAFEDLELNEKHGRALLSLDGRARAELMRQIESENLSGNEALRRAGDSKKPAAPAGTSGSTSGTRTLDDSVSRETISSTRVDEMVAEQGEEGANNRAPLISPSSKPPTAPINELQRGTGFDQVSDTSTSSLPKRTPHASIEPLLAALPLLEQANEHLILGAVVDAPSRDAIRRQVARLQVALDEVKKRA